MKNRLLCIAMAGLFAIGMISCGNPAEPEDFSLTADNVDNYITTIGNYEGLTVEAKKDELTDQKVEYYAKFYYELSASKVEGMVDEEGNVMPMTDEAIKMLNTKAYSTVNEFMVFVRGTVRSYIEENYYNDIENGAIKQVVEHSEFADEFPAGYIVKEKALIEDKFGEAAASYELDVAKYLEYCGTSEDEMAKEMIKEELVMMKIAKDEGIETEDMNAMKDGVKKFLIKVTKVKEPEK